MKKIIVLIFIIFIILTLTSLSQKSALKNTDLGATETTSGRKTVPSSNGWSSWTKTTNAIFSGPYHLVGDPSVLKDGPLYRMFYNCYDPDKKWGAVCEITSSDGISWNDLPTNDTLKGRVIKTRDENYWDTAHETPNVVKFKDQYFLYFTGYVHKGDFGKSFPYHIGLATSQDGSHFERYGNDPILSPSPGNYDNDAIFSPTIIDDDGKLVMVYTGFCLSNCKKGAGAFLLGASSIDGKTWTKFDKPIIDKKEMPFAEDGAGEASLLKGPDGYYYLFMTYLHGKKPTDIGVARSKNIFGPWDINSSPIVSGIPKSFDAKGVLAPSVIIDGERVRMWYHGFGDKSIDIGYAESVWPLKK